MPKGIYQRTDFHRKIISESKKGCTPWNKGKKIPFSKRKPLSDEHKKAISKTKNGVESKLKGRKLSQDHCNKLRIALTGKKQTREHIKKRLKRNPKSSLELKFEKIVNKLNLPYKFVGKGDFFIENKCPDFINTNGKKIAVEVYYKDHKEKFRKGLEGWKQERIQIFQKYGWEIKFFDETKVNIENIQRTIGGG